MNEMRKKIDEIDQQMAILFSERMALVEEIGKYKITHNLPILDLDRENKVMGNEKYVDIKYREEYRLFIKSVMDIAKGLENA